jgi:NTP pyrophosphatase (non-canonical NTP hydrolase)
MKRAASLSTTDYEAFHKRTCIRDFTPSYFMLGATEEASEVAEAIRGNEDKEVLKECGDVIWYITGLLRSIKIPLEALVGAKFDKELQAPDEKTESEALDERDLVMNLLMGIGSLAGRLKKHERGDYDKDQLAGFVKKLAPEVFTSLCALLKRRGSNLMQACEANITKIDSRLEKNMIKGDGSNREEEAPALKPASM